MLDDLNEDTDKASEALQAVTKKTKELIEQSGTPLLKIDCAALTRSLMDFHVACAIVLSRGHEELCGNHRARARVAAAHVPRHHDMRRRGSRTDKQLSQMPVVSPPQQKQ